MNKGNVVEYMVPTPRTIGEGIELSKAMEVMRENHVRHLPVLAKGKLVGILSERDIQLTLAVYPDAEELQVGDVMVEKPYSVLPETSMADVLKTMAKNKYGSVVVRDEKDIVLGIFTASDAIEVLADVLEQHEKLSYVPGGF
jgi:acetoin utilization protein AcuB